MWNPLKLFPNREIDEFSRTLARELAERYPIEVHQGAPERKSGKRAEKKADQKLVRALDGIYAKARRFRETNGLGLYGKARLGNTFKWELRDMGYEGEFVEEATRGLILNMSRK